MQSVLSWIWTRVAVSISYDDNHYTTGASIKNCYKQLIDLLATSYKSVEGCDELFFTLLVVLVYWYVI